MVRAVPLVAATLLAACASTAAPPRSQPLDDGSGELARASMHLYMGGSGSGDELADTPRRRHARDGEFGGVSYAGYSMPPWQYANPNRTPKYVVAAPADLVGVLAGRVTWTGAAPAKLVTACGAIANPTLKVGSDHGVGGVVVFIDKIPSGRAPAYYSRPASVGGVVAKHGCVLSPAAQVVAPLPAALELHSDAARATLRVRTDDALVKTYDLEEGGSVSLETGPGMTRIDDEAHQLTPAWVVALDTPYFALTDETGRFRIDELVPGTYDVTFFQPPLATSNAAGVISAYNPTVVHRSVRVDRAHPARLDLALPAR